MSDKGIVSHSFEGVCMMEIDFGREGPLPDDTPDFYDDDPPKRKRRSNLTCPPDLREEEDYRWDEGDDDE